MKPVIITMDEQTLDNVIELLRCAHGNEWSNEQIQQFMKVAEQLEKQLEE